MRDTAVVILNWNGRKFLEDFLPGVIATCDGLADVVVADNASSDDSVAWLRQHHPGILLIENGENGGFAKGYNDALSKLDHEFFLLLNSDIEVLPGWLEPLLARIRTDERIFAVQPKIRSWHQRGHFEYAGASGGFMDSLGYPFCRGRIFDVLEEDQGQYDEPADVFWATGACMLVRAKLFRELGGFDNGFFAHMEEIDLCWRALSHGYRNVCEPASVIYHIGGGTLPKRSSRKTFLNFRNNLLLLYKNLPLTRFMLLYPAKLALDGVAALKFLSEGSGGDFLAVVRAHAHFLWRAPRWKRASHKTCLRSHPQVMKGSIVWQHFVGKKRYFSELDV